MVELIEKLNFNSDGLIPVIIQDANSKDVLMLGYMNKQALMNTLSEGFVTFWSRSREELWKKGETSGNVQIVKSIKYDCDGDTLLISVDQVGVTCHTGTRTCFDDSPDLMQESL